MKITKAQIDALRAYDKATEDGTSISLTGPCGEVRLGTHVALLKKGLLEVASIGEVRTVYRDYSYNFGRVRISKGHLECDGRFRLTDAGRAVLAANS